MKSYLLLAVCLALVGCGSSSQEAQEKNHREVLARLEAHKTELAKPAAPPVRWAFANRQRIETTLFRWQQQKAEDFKKTRL